MAKQSSLFSMGFSRKKEPAQPPKRDPPPPPPEMPAPPKKKQKIERIIAETAEHTKNTFLAVLDRKKSKRLSAN